MAMILEFFVQPTPEEVVREHGPGVLRQLKRMFGPSADVDDVFQAVFVEVLRSLPRFRGRSKLSTWIHRITLNVAYQEMRMQYRSRESAPLDAASEPADTHSLEDEIVSRESFRLLYAGLEALDPKKRVAVVLHDVEGRPLREVAELLGRPLQTVASQVRSGRTELTAWIAERQRAPRRSSSVSGVQEGR